MFEGVFDSIKEVVNGTRLDEALSAAEISQMKDQVAQADVRPANFDLTIEGWLKRLELFWGKPEYEHIDPEFKIKKKVSKNEFLKRATDDQLLKMVGQWNIDKLDVNKVMLYRDYVGLNGKKFREKFIVTVKLKPELKKILR